MNPDITLPDNYVFKFPVLDEKGDVSHIIVFSRGLVYSPEMEAKFRQSVRGIRETTEILYSAMQIHLDDTVQIVKKKVIMELQNLANIDVAYEELFLYGYHNTAVDPETLFRSVIAQTIKTNPDKINADGRIVERVFAKYGVVVDTIKLSYSFSEFKQEFRQNIISESVETRLIVASPIGIRLHDNTDAGFIANPYETHTWEYGVPSCDSYETELLFQYGEFVDNTVYVCLAENVLKHTSPELSEFIVSVFYKSLFVGQPLVRSLDDLVSVKPALLEKTAAGITEKTRKYYDSVQIFHDVYHGRKTEWEYTTKGIQSVYFSISPDSSVQMPLETIFKLVHASKEIPMVKYNPGNRRENIYRLYSEKMSRNGKKVPFLSPKLVLRLSRDMGRSGQISMYIPTATKETVYLFFEQSGEVSVQIELRNALPETGLTDVIVRAVNPIFRLLNKSLDSVGISIPLFHSLRDSRIRIKDMSMTVSSEIGNNVDLKKIGCIQSVFLIETAAVNDSGAHLRFKRVANYREMDAQTIFINENQNDIATVIAGLVQNFQMTEDDAKQRIIAFFQEHEDIRGKVSENPGFPVVIRVPTMTSVVVFQVSKLTSIRYFDIVAKYIDSILRITQNIRSTSVSRDDIAKVCVRSSGLQRADVVIVPNIVSPDAVADTRDNTELLLELGISGAYENDSDVSSDDDLFFNYDENDESQEQVVSESLGETPTSNDISEEVPINPLNAPTHIDTNQVVSESLVENESPNVKSESLEESTATNDDVYSSDDDTYIHSDDDEKQKGGTENVDDERFKINPTGMPLTSNPFLKRMHQREPTLFLTHNTGKYKAYSTKCQSINSQPVILTDEEKRNIDNTNPGSYKHAIRYGTDPNNKFWYICPRFWCFLTNSSISEEDVRAGKCGKIIPKNSQTIPEGAYVYEFTSEKHKNAKGEYIQHYPGFMKDGLHPDGHCLPCCYKQWNSGQQATRYKQCMQENPGEPSAAAATKQRTENVKSSNYVLDSYPLAKSRWGFLPQVAKMLLGVDYRGAVDKSNPAVILPDKSVLLRYGVEQFPNQSFLGVFADVYAQMQNKRIVPTVADFREILCSAITLDIFVAAHNASLVQTFKPKNQFVRKRAAWQKYKDAEFVKKINTGDESAMTFIRDTVASYENFLAYLRNKDQIIDHTYLWDIFSANIETLTKGVNMILLEIKNNDVVDKIELVCPTQAFSAHAYNAKKKTVIVLKREEFYEPVYMYTTTATGDLMITKVFSQQNLHANVKQTIDMVRRVSGKYCASLPSMPKVYHFKPPVPLEDMLNILKTKSYVVSKYVLNYQAKIIGVCAHRSDESANSVVVPCYPGTMFGADIATVYMDDMDIWRDYQTTRDALTQIHADTNGRIPCMPKLKVVDEGLVVGILTETNQFVQLNPPSENVIEDGIPVYENPNWNTEDKEMATGELPDMERVRNTKRIHLESQFYSLFRLSAQKRLNDPLFSEIRENIVHICDNTTIGLRSKRAEIEPLLRKLMNSHVEFVEMDDAVLMEFTNVMECSTEENPYCLIRDDGSRTLLIPDKHLLSGIENSRIYFGRLADEMVRYSRIRAFLFQPRQFLNVRNVDYQIADSEIMMTQSSLSPDYFRDIVVVDNNTHIQHSGYDYAAPTVSQVYSNDAVSVEEQRADESGATKTQIECVKEYSRHIVGNTLSIWVRSFPKTARERVFMNTPECSFYVVVHILQDIYKRAVSVDDIRKLLWEGYSRLIAIDPAIVPARIVSILRKQGKLSLMHPVYTNTVSLETLVRSDEYYISDLDIWVIAWAYQLPIVLFTSTFLKGLVGERSWQLLGGKIEQPFYFIRTNITTNRNTIAEYHLVSPTLSIMKLGEFSQEVRSAFNGSPELRKNIQSLPEMLQTTSTILIKR